MHLSRRHFLKSAGVGAAPCVSAARPAEIDGDILEQARKRIREHLKGAPAGLLRDDMTPKPAYQQLHNLIRNNWWTRTQVQTAANGFVAFEGFLGRYSAEVPFRRGRLTGQFNLDASSRAPISVRLG